MLGKTYSLRERIKMNGIGSGRMIIEELNADLAPRNRQQTDINYASIELRPKGIIVHFSNRLDRYSWIIPYYRLVIFSAQTFSIHSNGKFIVFKKDKNYTRNRKFIHKMMDLKNAFLHFN